MTNTTNINTTITNISTTPHGVLWQQVTHVVNPLQAIGDSKHIIHWSVHIPFMTFTCNHIDESAAMFGEHSPLADSFNRLHLHQGVQTP